jgi:hypothetical protein
MTERGPWRALGDALVIVAVVILVGFVLVQWGPVGPMVAAIQGYLESRDLSPGAAENLAAGVVQTLVELILLTGAFALVGIVSQTAQRHRAQVQAARQIFGAYAALVKRLEALHNTGRERAVPTGSFLSFQIAQLGRALEALQARPLYFPGALPQEAADAFNEALDRLEPFYQFSDSLVAWAGASNKSDPTKDFYVRPAKKEAPAPPGADAFTVLHDQMMRFLRLMATPNLIKKAMKESLRPKMVRMGAAHPFVMVKRGTASE